MKELCYVVVLPISDRSSLTPVGVIYGLSKMFLLRPCQKKSDYYVTVAFVLAFWKQFTYIFCFPENSLWFRLVNSREKSLSTVPSSILENVGELGIA
jgi:hypothetical protein